MPSGVRPAAGPRDLGQQHRAVAVADLRRPRRFRRLDQLIAGRQHGDARRRDHGRGRAAHRGQQAELLRPQHRAGPQHHVAAAHFAAPRHDVPAGLQCGIVDVDAAVVGRARALDHDHRVGAGRHRAPVMMRVACRSPTARRGVWPAMTSSMTVSSPRPPGRSAGAHGVTVHHRLVVRRHVEVAGHVLREDGAEQRRGERDGFGRQRSGVGQDGGPGGGNGEHGTFSPRIRKERRIVAPAELLS